MNRSKSEIHDHFRCVVIEKIRLLSQMLGVLNVYFIVCVHLDAVTWNSVQVALDTVKYMD